MIMVRPRLRRRKGPIVRSPEFPGLRRIILWKTHTESLFRDYKGNPELSSRYNGGVPFAIRDFQPPDFETLWRIDQTCFAAGISYSRTELKVYMRRRGAFTLVAAGGSDASIAGFLVAEAGSRSRGHIITIDVIEAARRLGVGSLLLRAAEDRLRAAGSTSVELETAVDNVSALSFYKRHGYSVTRTFPRYYSNGVDALVLEKNLV
jgi:[ribosomal protein S18]-alanine N-acetyltransferase